jgi:hypothetical protein
VFAAGALSAAPGFKRRETCLLRGTSFEGGGKGTAAGSTLATTGGSTVTSKDIAGTRAVAADGGGGVASSTGACTASAVQRLSAVRVEVPSTT